MNLPVMNEGAAELPQSGSKPPQQQGKPFNPAEDRRHFLKKIAKLGVAAALPRGTQENTTPDVVRPVEKSEQKQESKAGFPEWSNLFQIVDEIHQAEKNPHLMAVVADIRLNMEKMREDFDRRMTRLDVLEQAMRADKDPDGTPQLVKLYQKMLGKMATLTPEDVIPFLVEKRMLYERLVDLEFLLRKTRDAKLGPDTSRQGETSKLALKWNAAAFHKGDPGTKYEYTRNHAAYTYMLVARDTADTVEKVSYTKGLTIEPHPGLRLTENGRKAFEEDKQKIEAFLQRFPSFKKIYGNIKLVSYRYNESREIDSGGIGGWFDNEKRYGERQHRTELVIFMDWDKTAQHLPETIFAHEAFGHALDVEINEGLADQLSPQAYIERLRFQHEILENPDWARHDDGIEGLFKPDPINRHNEEFVRKKSGITTAEFRGIITEYPRNLLLGHLEDTGWKFIDLGLRPVPGDPVHGEAFGFPFEWEAEKTYQTFGDFLHVYLPELRKHAAGGNIRSKIVLWGIERF
ncbi:MAG: hypothetical protein Q8R11_01325 [bacterium]|nr:hypothetical protein [bacterium]